MTPREIKETAAERALEIGLLRAFPELTESAMIFMLDAGRKTIEWEEAVTMGADFDVQACVAACRTSEVGQLIFAARDGDSGPSDHVAATADMSARDRINYAREHGLA